MSIQNQKSCGVGDFKVQLSAERTFFVVKRRCFEVFFQLQLSTSFHHSTDKQKVVRIVEKHNKIPK
jgi:hypothetical protein